MIKKNKYSDVRGYDMSYDKIKEICRKCWEEDFNCLYDDRSKKKTEGNYRFLNDNKNNYIECSNKTKPF